MATRKTTINEAIKHLRENTQAVNEATSNVDAVRVKRFEQLALDSLSLGLKADDDKKMMQIIEGGAPDEAKVASRKSEMMLVMRPKVAAKFKEIVKAIDGYREANPNAKLKQRVPAILSACRTTRDDEDGAVPSGDKLREAALQKVQDPHKSYTEALKAASRSVVNGMIKASGVDPKAIGNKAREDLRDKVAAALRETFDAERWAEIYYKDHAPAPEQQPEQQPEQPSADVPDIATLLAGLNQMNQTVAALVAKQQEK